MLNSETLTCKDNKLKVKTLHPQNGDSTWTRRLREILEQVDTELILLLLEDFFLNGDVDGERVQTYAEWMKEDKNIATIHFWPMDDAQPSEKYAGLGLRPQSGMYRMSAFAGMWRRQRLIDFLEVDENAWEWELAGTKRYEHVQDDFYSLLPGEPLVVPFNNFEYGIIGGKWTKKTVDLFNSYGLTFDFEKRGFYKEEYKALLPQTKAAFELDSKLYLDTGGGYNEKDCIAYAPIIKHGKFEQVYRVPQLSDSLVRWDPSSTLGFYIEGLHIMAELKNGKKVPINPACLGGNYIAADGKLVFVHEDPQVIIVLPAKKVVSVIIGGEAHCPLDEDLFDRAISKKQTYFNYRVRRFLKRFL